LISLQEVPEAVMGQETSDFQVLDCMSLMSLTFRKDFVIVVQLLVLVYQKGCRIGEARLVRLL